MSATELGLSLLFSVGAGTLHMSAENIAIHNGVYHLKYDGYIAVANCDYGDEYLLYFHDKWYFVAVSDCLNPKDRQLTLSRRYVEGRNPPFVTENPNGTLHWIVDIDKKIWGNRPAIPTKIILIRIRKENANNS